MTGQQIDRDRLRELASGATPGPWRFDRDQRDGWMVVFGGNEYPHGYNIIGSNEYLEPADAAFIAASRQAVPALLDMLDQAEQRIRDLTQGVRDEHAACLDQIEQVQARDARIQAAQVALDQAEAERDRQRAFKNEAHQFADRVIQEVADAAGIRVTDDGWALDDITAAIRQARTDHARAQVDRVRALHRHASITTRGATTPEDRCMGYQQAWPCPTVRTLDGEQ